MMSSDELDTKNEIQNDLASMTFEEILKLKEELGAKVYNEAILNVPYSKKVKRKYNDNPRNIDKDAPAELTAKRQVPFLGVELRKAKKISNLRDPRFDERAGDYKPWHFKEDYKFVSDIRVKEIEILRKELDKTEDEEKRLQVKEQIKRLNNQNVEDRRWHIKQANYKKEKEEVKRSISAGIQPHYLTKKERRAKELVAQFEELKSKGALDKHLEKRRKRNAAKDRRKIHLD